jgi:thiosulfate dehydrogenase [quinone] large subunit
MVKNKIRENTFGLLRIVMGLIFLWAFLDKLFGLGFATTVDKAWINGASPTSGFLMFAARGPFAPIFKSLAGIAVIDWLFMIGLLLIGLALILGISRKIAGYSGAVMMFLMWAALLPPEHHPFLDEHIVYLLVLIILANVKTKLSLSKWWLSTEIVKRFPFLE